VEIQLQHFLPTEAPLLDLLLTDKDYLERQQGIEVLLLNHLIEDHLLDRHLQQVGIHQTEGQLHQIPRLLDPLSLPS